MKTALAPETADRRTRDRVAGILLQHGAQTASELADRLGLTAAAIRRHLDAMLDAGTIVARDEPTRRPRGRGRPAKQFLLSDAGHSAGPTSYDAMAVNALRYLREVGGEAAVEGFARSRMAEWEARYAERIASLPLADRPQALAEALADDGYAATIHETALGVQFCQHHCPVQHVAEEFSVLCEVETEAIGRLTGRHVQRLATLARGNGVCTTHIPLTDITNRPGNAPGTPSGRTCC